MNLWAILLPALLTPVPDAEGGFALTLQKPNLEILHADATADWTTVRDFANAEAQVVFLRHDNCRRSFRLADLTVNACRAGDNYTLRVYGGDTCTVTAVEWPRFRAEVPLEVVAGEGATVHHVTSQGDYRVIVEWRIPDGLARPLVFGPVTVREARR